ncbi:hypothetical protein [Rhodoferax saidenbachensis]|uniref:DUF4124 domain-containing protein n=1 Tax=Rhodoferax saidenbachensis TaxID=1484693 RepID=A0A1P8K768_9BURK|nr:hypothetical protein [Rhodoferax saidenbachensis]APW41839.1 hypothetical protein RS694_04285 [Rhodoferax saidenbachensis]
MKNSLAFATLFIAACAIPTGAWSQKVYKCGSSYSQIPCADAVTVDTGDARSKAQKVEADKQTKQDAKAADAMEKARLKEEAQALAQNKIAGKTADKTKGAKSSAKADTKTEDELKKKKAKSKEPEFFTAKSAPDPKADGTKK